MRRATVAMVVGWILALAIASVPRAWSALSSVWVKWTAPSDDVGNPSSGPAYEYEMKWSTTPVGSDTTAWWAAATSVTGLPVPGNPGSTDSVEVTGTWSVGTRYYFVLRSSDEVPNWSAWSNAGQFYAPDSEVVLTFTAPADDDGNAGSGHASQYAGRWSMTAIPADTAGWWDAATAISGFPSPGAPGSTDSVVVNGTWQAGRNYYFSVRAADEVPNWSGFSSVQYLVADTTSSACATAPGL